MLTRGTGLLKNYIFLTGGELASKAVTFAAMAYLARVAGPIRYGYIEFAAAVVLCAGLLVDQGFGIYGAREIAKDPEHTNPLASEIVAVRYVLAVLAYLAVIGFVFILARSQAIEQLIMLYGASLLVMPLLMYWVFQGHNRMGVVALIQSSRQFVFAAVVFGFIRSADQIWIAGIAEVCGVLCAATFGVWAVNHYYHWKLFSRPKITKRLFKDGIPIGLSQLFWMVRMFGATVIIGLIAVPEDVGYFGADMRLFIAAHSFVYLYFFNLLPSLSKSWQRNDGSFSNLINNSFHLVSWLGVLIGVVSIIISPQVITLIYGVSFAPAGAAIQWLMLVLIIAALSGHYRFGLVAAGYQNKEMLTAAFGAISTVILLPIGYRLWGISGAAVGLLVAEVIVWLSSWWWANKYIGVTGHAKILIRPAIVFFSIILLSRLLPGITTITLAIMAGLLTLLLAFLIDPEVRRRFSQVAILPRSIVINK